MGLLGNYSVIQKSPSTFRSGTSVSEVRSNFNKAGPIRNRFAGDCGNGMLRFTAIPNGYLGPVCWSLPQVAGGIASYKNFTGSGSLYAELQATASIIASMSASGTLTATGLAVIEIIANLNATGTLTADSLAAALMSVDMSAYTGVTPASVAQAVWDELLASHTTPGSAGQALTDAGAAGNPWSALLADNTDPATFGEFVQKLLTTAKFLGLK